MAIRQEYASMSKPTVTEQLPSLRALHIHPTQTYLSNPSSHDPSVIVSTDPTTPGPRALSGRSPSLSDDSDAVLAPLSLRLTPLTSPRVSIDAQQDSAYTRKRRSPSSSGTIDSQDDEERVKIPCHRISKNVKSEKKAAKERAHRDGESFYRQTQEDMIVNYFDFRPSAKLAKGNKTSSGLEFPKATMQRAYIVVGAKLIDDSFKLAIREGRVNEWRTEWQQRIEEHIGDDERLLEGTLLDIPNEPRCCHANSKQQGCSTHGHRDWTECRRGRYRAAFQDNSQAYQHQATANRTVGAIR